jgi:hypothetical protein
MYGFGWGCSSIADPVQKCGGEIKIKYRVDLSFNKVKGPKFINTGSDVYEYQKYRVWRRYRVDSQI